MSKQIIKPVGDMSRLGVIQFVASLALGTLGSQLFTLPDEIGKQQIAQFQLTEQPETAVDFVLDAIEEQPETAEVFFLKYPNLTEEQKASIRDIYLQYALTLKTAVDNYLASVNLLNNLVRAETTNEAIAHVREEVMLHERTVYDVLFQRALAIRAVLTLEQRNQFNTELRTLLNLGTPLDASTFPENLIGQSADLVIHQLTLEGWELSVQTPRTLLFDKADQSLDLSINGDYKVEDAVLTSR